MPVLPSAVGKQGAQSSVVSRARSLTEPLINRCGFAGDGRKQVWRHHCQHCQHDPTAPLLAGANNVISTLTLTSANALSCVWCVWSAYSMEGTRAKQFSCLAGGSINGCLGCHSLIVSQSGVSSSSSRVCLNSFGGAYFCLPMYNTHGSKMLYKRLGYTAIE